MCMHLEYDYFHTMPVCLLYKCFFFVWITLTGTASGEEIEYVLKAFSSGSLLRFSFNDSNYRLVLTETYNTASTKIFVINSHGALDDLSESFQSTSSCKNYRGRWNGDSFYAEICSKWLSRGIVVRNFDHIILDGAMNDSKMTAQLYPNTGHSDFISRGVKIPKSNKWIIRSKRALQGIIDVNVDLAVFTEHRLFARFCQNYTQMDEECRNGIKNLNDYVKTIVTGADLFFDRINGSKLKISLTLVAILHNVRQRNKESGKDVSLFDGLEVIKLDGKYMVDAARALGRFSLYQHSYLNNQERIAVDHASLISVHDLISDESDGHVTVGIAYVGGVCNSLYRSSISKEKPGYNTLYILAHEIGHNLGADHDGKYEICPGVDNYIMASHRRDINLQNSYYFSCCSQIEMYFRINEVGSCLSRPNDSVEVVTTVYNQLPGVSFNRSMQCRTEFDDEHLPCSKETIEENAVAMGYTECEAHWCYHNSEKMCKISTRSPVLAGTPCDVGKWCIEGQCIPVGELDTGLDTPCDYSILDRSTTVRPESTEGALWSFKTLSVFIGKTVAVVLGISLFIFGVGFYIVDVKRRAALGRNDNPNHTLSASPYNR